MGAMENKTYYITTPIYYANAAPHVGHAYTTIAADALARLQRLRGRDVFFLTGTDEYGSNVAEAARKKGLEPKAYVDEVAAAFQATWRLCHVSEDRFIRTTDPDHHQAVQAMWRRLADAGDIYKGQYEGWYCVPDQTYFPDAEVKDGLCPNPECRRPLERRQEEAYFFRLSRYQQRLEQEFERHPHWVGPEFRRNEVLAFIRQGLRDTCVSRPASGWGIPVPDDPSQVVYVWIDALVNYLTGAGWPQDSARFQDIWPPDEQLMSKDIFTRFHCTIWPAMLMAAGLPQPRRLFGHGYWNFGGRKMSKSRGNVVSPAELSQELAARSGCSPEVAIDAIRYFLLREISFGQDGDFSTDALIGRFNADLANDLGNLLNRTLQLAHRYFGGKVPAAGADGPLAGLAEGTARTVEEGFASLQFSDGLKAVWAFIGLANRSLDERAPWSLHKQGQALEAGEAVAEALEAVRIATVWLEPVMPVASLRLRRQLGDGAPTAPGGWAPASRWGRLQKGTVLETGRPVFPRIDTKARVGQGAGTGRLAQAIIGKQSMNDTSSQTPALPIQEFQKLDLRVGRILSAERIEGADKLLKLFVDLGEEERTVVAGIAQHYDLESLVGKSVVLVANLAPAKIRGVVSQGMVLAADSGDRVVLVSPESDVPLGSKVR